MIYRLYRGKDIFKLLIKLIFVKYLSNNDKI